MTMLEAEITNIDYLKDSDNKGEKFIRVYFRIHSKKGTQWAKTDLVPTFRNFKHWEKLLKVGNRIADFRMKDSQTIDADSRPFLRRQLEMKPENERAMRECQLYCL